MACVRDPLVTCNLYQGGDLDFLQGARLREQTGKSFGCQTGCRAAGNIRVCRQSWWNPWRLLYLLANHAARQVFVPDTGASVPPEIPQGDYLSRPGDLSQNRPWLIASSSPSRAVSAYFMRSWRQSVTGAEHWKRPDQWCETAQGRTSEQGPGHSSTTEPIGPALSRTE
jgi:hypothetical protein